MAATPMAMPSADSAGPQLAGAQPDAGQPGQIPRPQPSRADGRRAAGPAAMVMSFLRCAGRVSSPGGDRAGVGDDVPVEHLDAPPHPGGDGVVVGDHDDRGTGGVELFQQGEERRAGAGVEVPGRLVGQHDRRAARDRPGDRDPLSLPARQLGRPRTSAVRQPDPVQRGQRELAAPGAGHPGVQQSVGDVVDARSRARPGRTAGTRTRSASPAARTAPGRSSAAMSRPVTRTVPAVGRSSVPIRCSSVVLPEPDGPTMPASSPAVTARLT